jgi:ATP-dependent DNA helicase RecG
MQHVLFRNFYLWYGEITGIASENSMKNVFYRLRDRGLIEPVPGRVGFASAWRRSDQPNEW